MLIAAGQKVRVGMEASGHARWFERLLTELVEIVHRHEVRFYSDGECFLDSFTKFIAASLKAGKAVLVIAIVFHRDSAFF